MNFNIVVQETNSEREHIVCKKEYKRNINLYLLMILVFPKFDRKSTY